MPLLKSITAPNGAMASYHRVVSIEGRFPDLIVNVQSFADRGSYLAGRPPLTSIPVPFDAASHLAEFEAAAQATENFSGATVEADDAADLEVARTRRWAAIKDHREARDNAPIELSDFALDADQTSRMDIMGAVMAMQINGQTSRQWRCADNVMRELTLAQLIEAGTAIANRRQSLIETSAALYAQIQAATTAADVAAITWPTT